MTFFPSIREVKESNYKLVLSKTGLISYHKDIPITIRFNKDESNRILNRKIDYDKYDNFCEVAHLEISNSCNMKCDYCYVGKKSGKELDTEQWMHIIKNLADAGVFQVSFGGGEPTLRKDLLRLAAYVKECGMNLGMTTNGTLLPQLDLNEVKKYFNQINVSWHGDYSILDNGLDLLEFYDIPRGINYTYSKSMESDNENVKYLSREYSAEILYLVYKPVIDDWDNQIPGNEVYKVAKAAANEGLKVAVDGPCVNQCLMKKKFVDVDSTGTVFPCSFMRNNLGNLLVSDFKELWSKRGLQDKCLFVNFESEEGSDKES